MPITARLGAFALLGAIAFIPATASADDPRDPTMQTKEARERDRQIIRRLNQEQLDYVRRRDAEYAKGWEATRQHEKDMEQYRRDMERYERDMAEWRYAVKMCRSGHREYCAR
ncbi:hypothetical protein WAB17_10310 [Parerythrobacter aurantius]|uniref:hypothetical protein n=1 Tax=Parerythrobacter aurantius TaxID=3127706 RepID=UPI00325362D9